jgi:uncharacterized protein YbaP (TraB family)
MNGLLSFLTRRIRCLGHAIPSIVVLAIIFCSQPAFAKGVISRPSTGLLFEIKSGANTMYLFGSIHLAKADFYPLSPQIEQAYAQADAIAVEADVTDTIASKNAMPLMTYASPDKLQNHLTSTTWQSLQAILGPAAEQLQGFKPAVAAMGLTLGVFAQQGYDPSHGLDLYFIHRAKADKKKLVELESLAFQAAVLGGLTDEEGDALLKQSLDALSNGEALENAERMVKMWQASDAAGLAFLFSEATNKDPGTKKLMKLLLDDRNVAMTQKIHRMLVDGNKVFVVVGAGHLTGANSVIDLLQKQGVQVRQLP